jgi:hypothetical protein
LWKSLQAVISQAQHATYCISGIGDKTTFWQDSWSELGRLCFTVPALYLFAIDQECTLASQWVNGAWNIKLHTPMSRTAAVQLQNLLAELHISNHNDLAQGDTRRMTTTRKTSTATAFYKLFNDPGILWTRPYNWVWHSVIPHRHKIFLWLAYREMLNTKDNMTRKTWCNDAGCDQCPAIESIQHILHHCREASWVWNQLGVQNLAAQASNLAVCTAWPERHSVQHLADLCGGLHSRFMDNKKQPGFQQQKDFKASHSEDDRR